MCIEGCSPCTIAKFRLGTRRGPLYRCLIVEQPVTALDALVVSEGVGVELALFFARIAIVEKGWWGIGLGARLLEIGARLADASVPNGSDAALRTVLCFG
jgi:hypothetical protein